MSIEILIPTFNKTKEQIQDLVKFLNIKTNALFANQNGKTENYNFEIDDHLIRVICTNTIGVSKNRNILLDNCCGDICVCIDDDCPLVENYVEIIDNFYRINQPDYAVFNGNFAKKSGKLVYSKKTKLISHYSNISSAGGPGFTFCRSKIIPVNLRYDESVGTPNYICAGEDSLFYRDLLKTKLKGYRVFTILFTISNEETDSSYFSGINEQYVTTRGYITYLLHPCLFHLYKVRHIIRFKRMNPKLKLHELIKFMNCGRKMTSKK